MYSGNENVNYTAAWLKVKIGKCLVVSLYIQGPAEFGGGNEQIKGSNNWWRSERKA